MPYPVNPGYPDSDSIDKAQKIKSVDFEYILYSGIGTLHTHPKVGFGSDACPYKNGSK
ncbi:hypothetical protein MTBBW1_1050020 [Desulfamplus magnetovallimortis]|uniref:Uncharacterized protein n=1 Tax=Desulfamplus magnetovallimortis TaxID=1246637 RepID=A0A1W1H5C2_9BACT|nr:hypothetical protein [Desulfamplus magnetovallimortis]SLM27646.1 hypothetical protein MTBBW1_1050020 [Desulfamplus magnetovallimortis]